MKLATLISLLLLCIMSISCTKETVPIECNSILFGKESIVGSESIAVNDTVFVTYELSGDAVAIPFKEKGDRIGHMAIRVK